MREPTTGSGVIVPVIMTTFAAVYIWTNRDVSWSDMRLALPTAISLTALSVLVAARRVARRDRALVAATASQLRRPAALIAASILLLGLAGWDFPIAAGVFLAIAIPMLGYRRWVVVAAIAVVFPITLHLGFNSLGLPLASVWLRV